MKITIDKHIKEKTPNFCVGVMSCDVLVYDNKDIANIVNNCEEEISSNIDISDVCKNIELCSKARGENFCEKCFTEFDDYWLNDDRACTNCKKIKKWMEYGRGEKDCIQCYKKTGGFLGKLGKIFNDGRKF